MRITRVRFTSVAGCAGDSRLDLSFDFVGMWDEGVPMARFDVVPMAHARAPIDAI